MIRRELDINEGDPYNRALIDRAERRIKNLNYFKSVKITDEPGSAPDRVVINIDVVEQPTGDFSMMGGYSTVGRLVGARFQSRSAIFSAPGVCQGRGHLWPVYPQRRIGLRRAVFPRYPLQPGIDLFAKETLANTYLVIWHRILGGTLKWGHAAARRPRLPIAIFGV